MYKRQMRVEKILCFLAIAVSAAVFIYSLGIMTDLYDSLYMTMRNPNDLTKTSVPGSIVYYTMQGFTQMLMLSGLGLILLAVLLFLTNTHVRRKYYVGNYLSVGLWSAAALAVSVWGIFRSTITRASFCRWILKHCEPTRICGRPCIPSPPSGLMCIMSCLVS